MRRGTRALAAATGAGLLLTACAFDTSGFDGAISSAQIAFVGDAPNQKTEDHLVDVIEGRMAAVGISDSKIDVRPQGLVVEVGDHGQATIDRAFDVATRTGLLRIRPVLSIRDGSREDITTDDEDVPGEPIVLQQADPAGAVVTYELGPAVGPDEIHTVAGTTTSGSQWGISLDLAGDAVSAVQTLAAECTAKAPTCPSGRIAFVVDSVVISALTPDQLPAEGAPIELYGSLEETSARDLATILQSGPLPVALKLEKVESLG